MKHLKTKTLTLGLLAALGMASCGGGGGANLAGIGGTGIVAVGQITGFGSVFVNGVEYFLKNDSQLLVNNTPVGQSNLKLGMVVTISGTLDNSGQATINKLVYDAEVRGPIGAAITTGADLQTKTLDIMGKTIIVDAVGTSFSGNYSFDGITQNDLVEVSGFIIDGNGTIQATHIERHSVFSGSDTVEIKGRLSSFVLNSSTSFLLDNNITVSFDPNGGTDMSSLGTCGLGQGCYLEIEGLYDPANNTINASKIEAAASALPESSDEAEIEGVITDFVSLGNFKINGIKIDASSATLEPSSLTLANGSAVEVEGSLAGGTLLAENITGRGGDIEIEAYVVGTPTNNIVKLQITDNQTIDVVVNDSQTRMEDETGAATSTMKFADIADNNFLEIKATQDNSGNIVATTLKRKNGDDGEVILQGPLDVNSLQFNGTVTLNILGVAFSSNSSTEFQEDDGSDTDPMIDINTFFSALTEISGSVVVKIKDKIPGGTGITLGDGIADEMEIKL
ncbi:MAG: DUF5666 domain-containing protein [Gammaproteobacteria bacterium]